MAREKQGYRDALERIRHEAAGELALAVGYTDRSSVAKIELGKVDLSLSKVAAIAQALHQT